MKLNPSSKVRGILYIFTAVGSIVVTYLAATGVIGANETAAWTAFTALIASMAGFNVTPEK